MKKVLLFVFISIISMYINSNAQLVDTTGCDCDQLIERKLDEFNPDRDAYTIKRKEIMVVQETEEKALIFNFFSTNYMYAGKVWVYIGINGVGCINEYNDIEFLFVDATKLKINSNEDFNCEERASFLLEYDDKDWTLPLTTKEIKAVRTRGDRGFVTVKFSEEQAKLFIRKLKCISFYAQKFD